MARTRRTTHALVMGGTTSDFSTTIEMLTPDSVCTPDIPPLPVGRVAARSVFYHDKIYYCGGFSDDFSPQATRHSLSVLEEEAQWQQESSLVMARRGFTMTVVFMLWEVSMTLTLIPWIVLSLTRSTPGSWGKDTLSVIIVDIHTRIYKTYP